MNAAITPGLVENRPGRSRAETPKLLYLGLAFPPGYADIFPEAQPAGHLIETSLINSVRPWFDIRSVGISWLRLDRTPAKGTAPGLPHELNLLECKPELIHRLQSLRKLRHQWRAWAQSDWIPDVVVVCNFSPVYNAFVRWLRQRAECPALVLYLADSVGLQQTFPLMRRVRYALKPLRYADSEMVPFYDASVAVSKDTEAVFKRRQMPWLWLPNGIDPQRAIFQGGELPAGKIRFGYFGTLAPHGGVDRLINTFKQLNIDAELHICGWGKNKEGIQHQCDDDLRLRLLGPKSPDECVRFARDCDVMVNPRPIMPGNENNFSSKVFEYALSGRVILTSRLSGVDDILGPEALYFDASGFESSLLVALQAAAQTARSELDRRGNATQQRLLREFTWAKQGKRLREFLLSVSRPRSARASGLPR